MATTRAPRKGSMQFWPRKKASRPYSRIRTYTRTSEPKLLGFAGYKAGMTHVIVIDNRATSHTKGSEVFYPVTVIECPPIKIASIRLYKSDINGLKLSKEIFTKADVELARKTNLPKKIDESKLATAESEIKSYAEVRVHVYTQPKLTTIGKKKPELFELAIGGNVEQQFAYAKGILGKEVKVSDVIKEGQQLDARAVTTGKGYQGPVKRHGVTLRPSKSEKGQRGPGNLGAWTGNRSWTVAHAGQMGFNNRMDRNKWVLKIAEDPKLVNVDGGFLNYGVIKNTSILIKGSLGGTSKRLIRFTFAERKNKLIPEHAPQISHISLQSKQGL